MWTLSETQVGNYAIEANLSFGRQEPNEVVKLKSYESNKMQKNEEWTIHNCVTCDHLPAKHKKIQVQYVDPSLVMFRK